MRSGLTVCTAFVNKRAVSRLLKRIRTDEMLENRSRSLLFNTFAILKTLFAYIILVDSPLIFSSRRSKDSENWFTFLYEKRDLVNALNKRSRRISSF